MHEATCFLLRIQLLYCISSVTQITEVASEILPYEGERLSAK